MSYTAYIIEIIKFIGLPALISIGVSAYLKLKFDAKLEKIKSKNLKKLANFQAELDYIKTKQNFKFTKLHEIRLKVLARTHHLLNENLALLEDFTAPTKIIPEGKTFEVYEKEFSLRYKEAHNKFIRYFKHNAIYFSEDMERLILNYINASSKIFDTYDRKIHFPKSDDQIIQEAYTVYRKIPVEIHPLKEKIEVKFRELLGE